MAKLVVGSIIDKQTRCGGISSAPWLQAKSGRLEKKESEGGVYF
jgi:hypothetical protein